VSRYVLRPGRRGFHLTGWWPRADNSVDGTRDDGGGRANLMVRWGVWMCTALGAVVGCAAPRSAPPAPLPPRPTAQRPLPPRRVSVPPPQRVSPPASSPVRVAVPRDWFPNSGRVSPRWTTIVIHHSATDRGSARSFDKYHRGKGWDELGYHFVIGNGTETPDGFVEAGSRWNSQKHGAHCKTPDNYFNDHGVGICLVGDFTKSGPTRRQLDALRDLVAFLCHECRIRPERITTHHAVNGKTACPGHFFSLASLQRSVGASASARGR